QVTELVGEEEGDDGGHEHRRTGFDDPPPQFFEVVQDGTSLVWLHACSSPSACSVSSPGRSSDRLPSISSRSERASAGVGPDFGSGPTHFRRRTSPLTWSTSFETSSRSLRRSSSGWLISCLS